MYDRHVFVCQNDKGEGKVSCGRRGGVQICETLKARAKAHPALQNASLRVNKSGCLGPCEEGPNMVIYPEGVWYAGVKPEDVTDILESHLVHGQPVERLRKTKPATKT